MFPVTGLRDLLEASRYTNITTPNITYMEIYVPTIRQKSILCNYV